MSLLRGLFLVLFCVHGNAVANDRQRWVDAIASDDTAVIRDILVDTDSASELLALRSETGKDALMIACKRGDMALVKQLIGAGADPDSKTNTGGSPVMYASLGSHIDVMRFLLSHGADINAQGTNGWSALTIAAAKGFDKLAQALIDAGARVDVHDVYGWSALMRAVDNNHAQTVRVLLASRQADLNVQEEGGNTALHLAAAAGNDVMVKLLLQAKADKSLTNRQGSTARQLAAALPNGGSLAVLFDSD